MFIVGHSERRSSQGNRKVEGVVNNNDGETVSQDGHDGRARRD